MMFQTLQIPHSIKVVHDAIITHLNLFERTHRDHFTYVRLKEGYGIEYFDLRLTRRKDDYWDEDAPTLGIIRLRPLSTTMTEIVLQDSALLEIGPDAFLTSNIRLWEDEEEEERPKVTLKQWKSKAAATFERFKGIHEELRESVIKGLREDQLLSGRQKVKPKDVQATYVDKSRIAELRQVRSTSFDVGRLIVLCEELNRCFASSSFCATTALVRAVTDHVPPIFGARTFAEVANNVGEKSTKASLHRLETSSRHIADSVLHQQIRRRESIPNRTQVNFSNDLDVLLSEIIRRLT